MNDSPSSVVSESANTCTTATATATGTDRDNIGISNATTTTTTDNNNKNVDDIKKELDVDLKKHQDDDTSTTVVLKKEATVTATVTTSKKPDVIASSSTAGTDAANTSDTVNVPQWYVAKENDTPKMIAAKFHIKTSDLVKGNKSRLPDLLSNSRLKAGTRIKITHLDIDDDMYIPYCHWTFPDDTLETSEPSYMMALRLNRKRPNSTRKGHKKPYEATLDANIVDYVPNTLTMNEKMVHIEKSKVAKANAASEAATKAARIVASPSKCTRSHDNDHVTINNSNNYLCVNKNQEQQKQPLLLPPPQQQQQPPPQQKSTEVLMKELGPPPTKPKRPNNSYLLYCNENRPRVMMELRKDLPPGQENPKAIDITRELSKAWSNSSQEYKDGYQKQFDTANKQYYINKEKYDKAMVEYEKKQKKLQLSIATATTTQKATLNSSGGILGSIGEAGYDMSAALSAGGNLFNKVVKLDRKQLDIINNDPTIIDNTNNNANYLDDINNDYFKYYYVLTYIPDLQWCHLAPLQQVGIYGNDKPKCEGRPIWMLVDENEGKELDISASLCIPVRARSTKRTVDADQEQWDIMDSIPSKSLLKDLSRSLLYGTPSPVKTGSYNNKSISRSTSNVSNASKKSNGGGKATTGKKRNRSSPSYTSFLLTSDNKKVKIRLSGRIVTHQLPAGVKARPRGRPRKSESPPKSIDPFSAVAATSLNSKNNNNNNKRKLPPPPLPASLPPIVQQQIPPSPLRSQYTASKNPFNLIVSQHKQSPASKRARVITNNREEDESNNTALLESAVANVVVAAEQEQQTEEKKKEPVEPVVEEPQGPFDTGTIVMVEKRTWVGINKPGGVGRVTKCTTDGPITLYDVAYVLGGKEKNIDSVYVKLHKILDDEEDDNNNDTNTVTDSKDRRKSGPPPRVKRLPKRFSPIKKYGFEDSNNQNQRSTSSMRERASSVSRDILSSSEPSETNTGSTTALATTTGEQEDNNQNKTKSTDRKEKECNKEASNQVQLESADMKEKDFDQDDGGNTDYDSDATKDHSSPPVPPPQETKRPSTPPQPIQSSTTNIRSSTRKKTATSFYSIFNIPKKSTGNNENRRKNCKNIEKEDETVSDSQTTTATTLTTSSSSEETTAQPSSPRGKRRKTDTLTILGPIVVGPRKARMSPNANSRKVSSTSSPIRNRSGQENGCFDVSGSANNRSPTRRSKRTALQEVGVVTSPAKQRLLT